MLRAFLFSLFVICSILSSAQSNMTDSVEIGKARFGIKAGINASIFSASINSEVKPKIGLHIGFYFRKAITQRFFFRPEFYYSNQGEKDNYTLPPSA
jgi:hypothetical protein